MTLLKFFETLIPLVCGGVAGWIGREAEINLVETLGWLIVPASILLGLHLIWG